MAEPTGEILKYIEKGRKLVNNGQAEAAIRLYEKAAGVANKLGQKEWEGYFWQQRGVAFMTAEKYEEAVSSIERAISVFNKIDDKISEGNAHRDLGIVKTKQKKYDEAIMWFSVALDELLTNSNDWNAIGVTEAKLASAYQMNGDLNKAREEFDRALSNIRRMGNWFMEMTTLLGFASLDFEEKKYSEMITKLWACLGLIYEKGDYKIQKRRLVEIYGMLYHGYSATGATELAQKYLIKAEKLMEEMPMEVRESLMKQLRLKTSR